MTKLLILMNFQSRLHAKIGKESWLREKQIHLFFQKFWNSGNLFDTRSFNIIVSLDCQLIEGNTGIAAT